MADTSGILTLNDVVDRFLVKNKLPKDDYFVYLEHATDCYRELNLHHGSEYKQSVVTADSLGRVTMPTDLVDLIGVYVPYRGRRWFFTYDDNLVTTVTGDGDAFDTDYGEGLDVTDRTSVNYGATAGKNTYYMSVDWNDRIIYITNMASTKCTVVYVSSGVNLDGTTYIMAKTQGVFDAYLRWQKAIIDNQPIGIQQLRKADYDEAVLMLRRTHLPSASEFRDTILQTYVQAPIR